MPRGEFHKVGGRQAREALEYGWVKIDEATADRFFGRGVPITVTGTRVHPAQIEWLSETMDPHDGRWSGVKLSLLLPAIEAALVKTHPAAGAGLAYFVRETDYPFMPRGARDRMPGSMQPRELLPEAHGARWLRDPYPPAPSPAAQATGSRRWGDVIPAAHPRLARRSPDRATASEKQAEKPAAPLRR